MNLQAADSLTDDRVFMIGMGDHVQLQLESGLQFWAKVDDIRKDVTYRAVAVTAAGPVHKGHWIFFEKQNVFVVF